MKSLKIYNYLWVVLLALVVGSCSDDNEDDTAPAETGMPDLTKTTIWAGESITFEKADDTDPGLAENQDRITAKVWITRANRGGGQIYNAVTETAADKDKSPAGTLWARGTTADLQNLEFDLFRATVGKPKDNVGVDLVLLLVEENIAIDLKFSSWSQQELGGFTYTRSTPEQ